MKPQEKLDSITAELDANEKRLFILRRQKANKGLHTEPHIEIDISQTQETIEYLHEYERFYRGELGFSKIASKNALDPIVLIRRAKEILDTIIPRTVGMAEDNRFNTLINDMYSIATEYLENSIKLKPYAEALYLLAKIFDKDESHPGALYYCCLCVDQDPNHIDVRKLRLSTSQFLLKNGDPDPQELKKYIIEDKAKLVEAGQFSEEMIWIELD